MSRSLSKQEIRALACIQEFKTTFGGENGKRVLYELQKRFWFLEPTYCPGDPDESKFREGQRSVVLAIMATLNQDQAAIEEAIKNRRTEENDL